MNPPDELLIGNVASSISSAREIVSRVAAVASASFSMSPVRTAWLVRRNDSTSRMDCWASAFVGAAVMMHGCDNDDDRKTIFRTRVTNLCSDVVTDQCPQTMGTSG